MQQQEKISKELIKLTESYKKNYQPNVNEGLVRLRDKIDSSNTHKVKHLPTRSRLMPMAAAILLLIGLGASYQLFFTSNSNLQQLQATNEMIHTFLPDGSEVFLNKHSQLSFPEKFEGAKRIVQLNGEAFFKVKKDQTQPFIVQTGSRIRN